MKEVGEMQGVEVREREETERQSCGLCRGQVVSQSICSIYGVGICTQHFVSQCILKSCLETDCHRP